MLHAQIFQSQQRPHPQKPRQFDSQENYFESLTWKVEFFLLLALLSKYVRIMWYFLRYQQWVLPTAAFHCFALHGLHGGSLMSSYCLKFESSCRAAEMKSFGESKLCHIVLQSPSRFEVGVFECHPGLVSAMDMSSTQIQVVLVQRSFDRQDDRRHMGGSGGSTAGAGLRSRESANSKGEQRPRWLALSQVRSHASDPQHTI